MTRYKRQMILKHKLRGCFVKISRRLPAEALAWLTRGGQSVRLPVLPAAPAALDNIEEEQQDQVNQPNQNLVEAVEVDMNPINPLRVYGQEQIVQLNEGEKEFRESRNCQQIAASKRRVSVAGGIFFSVDDKVRETGSDFMTKPIMESYIIAQPVIQNQFDPFRRIQNPPFAMRGRQRAASQDGYFLPRLPSIPE